VYGQQPWRYPVKSMAGEALEHAELRLDGIAGDRLVVVHAPNGLAPCARGPNCSPWTARCRPDGEALVGTCDGVGRGPRNGRARCRPERPQLALLDGADRFDVC